MRPCPQTTRRAVPRSARSARAKPGWTCPVEAACRRWAEAVLQRGTPAIRCLRLRRLGERRFGCAQPVPAGGGPGQHGSFSPARAVEGHARVQAKVLSGGPGQRRGKLAVRGQIEGGGIGGHRHRVTPQRREPDRAGRFPLCAAATRARRGSHDTAALSRRLIAPEKIVRVKAMRNVISQAKTIKVLADKLPVKAILLTDFSVMIRATLLP